MTFLYIDGNTFKESGLIFWLCIMPSVTLEFRTLDIAEIVVLLGNSNVIFGCCTTLAYFVIYEYIRLLSIGNETFLWSLSTMPASILATQVVILCCLFYDC